MRVGMRILLIGVAFAVVAGCSGEGREQTAKETERVVVAVTPWPASAALYVAQEKGYFKDEGLEVAFDTFISGHLGLEAALSGKADFATAGDTPIARAAIEAKPVAVVATLCEINRAVMIVARKDHGILSPEDLRGKRIGVVLGTTADFFLHIFLATSYVNPLDVIIVGLETEGVVDALTRGEVDAVSTWFPHTLRASARLGDRGILLEDPSIYKMTWNLAASQDFATNHPDRVIKVLRPILRANRLIMERAEEARAVASMHLGEASGRLDKEWEDYRFTAALDQSLLLNLEDQARWMLRQEPGGSRGTPNFTEFIYTEGLKTVQPAGVGITGR